MVFLDIQGCCHGYLYLWKHHKKSRCSKSCNWSLPSTKFLKVVSIKRHNVVITFTNQFFLHSFSYLRKDSCSVSDISNIYWCHLILLPASLDACWWLARAAWKATNLYALHVEWMNSNFVYNSRGGEFFYTLVLTKPSEKRIFLLYSFSIVNCMKGQIVFTWANKTDTFS